MSEKPQIEADHLRRMACHLPGFGNISDGFQRLFIEGLKHCAGRLNMKRGCLLVILFGLLSLAVTAQLAYVEDPAKGTLTVRDGMVSVLTYCFGDQLKAGIDPKYTQSSYIHPLFSLDGQALTDDSPADHLHHHGLFWTWPVVLTRGAPTATWEPKRPRLRQFFVRWLRRETAGNSFLLDVENAWKLDGKEIVAAKTP
jgi:hypothetical protein